MTRRKSHAESVRRLCSTEDDKTPNRKVKEELDVKPDVCKITDCIIHKKTEQPLDQESMDLAPPLPNYDVADVPVDQPHDPHKEDWSFEKIMEQLRKLKSTAEIAKGVEIEKGRGPVKTHTSSAEANMHGRHHGRHGGMIGSGVAVNFSNEFFNPPCPVQIPVAGFNHGQRLRMVVVPTHHNSGRFAVNLKSPQDIVLHFNPRFDERAVVRNSTHHGHWQNEERHCDHFPFTPNHVYTLEFISSHGQVEVLVNGNLFCAFAERAPGHSIHQIEIEGDVVVHSAHVTH